MTITRRKLWMALGVAAVIVAGFFVFRGLDDATMYFRTADEAIAQREELADERFRIEGIVVPGSIGANGAFTNFVIESRGTTVNVRNQGQPVGIFQENIPVVLEGAFQEGTNIFASDRVMVRHTSDYQAEYPDRVSGEANR